MRPLTHLLAAAASCGGLLWLAGCIESYAPDVVNAPASYLVVDGFINGNGATRLKLSRTQSLSATTSPPAEAGATVFIVDDTGRRYALPERRTGFYQSDSLVLSSARRYQLRIATAGPAATAATYESDLVPLKVTPPIDKVDWKFEGDQLLIRLSTHDPTGQSRFYRWTTTETWQFNSAFESTLEYRGGIVQDRLTPIYTCWRTEQASLIKQGSSAQFSQDALTDFQLLSYSSHAERFKIRYSLLVQQVAELPEEFAYLEVLRKNTEAVGTVNDPLPSQLTGNVHRVGSPGEPVLGFVGAHTVQQRRIFINRADLSLPSNWVFDSPYASCNTDVELVPDPRDKNPIFMPHTRVFSSPDNVPIGYYLDGGKNVGYVGSTAACVDCRLRGSTTKPVFW